MPTRRMMMRAALVPLLVAGLGGCAVTEKTPTSDVRKSGFLRDYSELKPGTKDQATLVYFAPNVDWNQYDSVLIEPVSMWTGADSKISAQDGQTLTAYYYNVLKENLSKNLKIATEPGPHVMTLRVALTDATTATPGLRTVSVIVPQARLLGAVKNMATGTYAFVGSAQSEGEVLDSVSGRRLAAAVDGRSGGLSIKNADVWQWGDAEQAMNFWAQRTDQRLMELKSGVAAAK